MEKVKLTREQAEAIEWLTDGAEGSWTHEELINVHAREPFGWDSSGDVVDATVLNGMPLLKLVDALRIGYEVEEEYKVGDWVVATSNSIAKVTRVEGDRIYAIWRKGENEMWNIHDDLRHATPEEIKAEKERRVWAGIGREPGVFMYGDVVVDRNGTHWCELINMRDLYKEGSLQGFHPAESFIEFGGGE